MTQRRYAALLVAAIVSGFLGAMFSSRYFGVKVYGMSLEATTVTANTVRLLGPDGMRRAEINTDENGGGITLYSSAGAMRAILRVRNDEEPVFALFDRPGRRVLAQIGTTEDSPYMIVKDKNGNGGIELLSNNTIVSLLLYNRRQELRLGDSRGKWGLGVSDSGIVLGETPYGFMPGVR